MAEGTLEAGRAFGGVEIAEPVGPALLGALVHGHLQEDVGPAGLADRAADGVDVLHDIARHRNLDRGARLDEAVLHVDDHVGGAGEIEPFEHVQGAASLAAGELDRLGRDTDLVHVRLPSCGADHARRPAERARFDRPGGRVSDASEPASGEIDGRPDDRGPRRDRPREPPRRAGGAGRKPQPRARAAAGREGDPPAAAHLRLLHGQGSLRRGGRPVRRGR